MSSVRDMVARAVGTSIIRSIGGKRSPDLSGFMEVAAVGPAQWEIIVPVDGGKPRRFGLVLREHH